MKYILLTGGTGFIGSHTAVELLNAGYNLLIVDNLSNSDIQTLENIRKAAGLANNLSWFRRVQFYQADIAEDMDMLMYVFNRYAKNITAVMHFAGLKSVSESIQFPEKYYRTNLVSTLNLIEAMTKNNCHNLIFSSSATVYGDCASPITEEMEIGHGISNPYGQTKFMIERILQDVTRSNSNWNIISLRYFNPVGSHPSGFLPENPRDHPNNLMPHIIRVAERRIGYPVLNIYGNDYPTSDGTAMRDFIHVVDLAQGHLAALEKMSEEDNKGYNYYNLGTGKGVTVMELVNAFMRVNGTDVPYCITDRRPGDLACVYADVEKAKRELGWTAELGIDDMVRGMRPRAPPE